MSSISGMNDLNSNLQAMTDAVSSKDFASARKIASTLQQTQQGYQVQLISSLMNTTPSNSVQSLDDLLVSNQGFQNNDLLDILSQGSNGDQTAATSAPASTTAIEPSSTDAVQSSQTTGSQNEAPSVQDSSQAAANVLSDVEKEVSNMAKATNQALDILI
jgi:hypothetical protein